MRKLKQQVGWRLDLETVSKAKIAAFKNNQSVSKWIEDTISMRVGEEDEKRSQGWIISPSLNKLPEDCLLPNGDVPLNLGVLFNPVEVLRIHKLKNDLNTSEQYLIDYIWAYVWTWWCVGRYLMKPKLTRIMDIWSKSADPYTEALEDTETWCSATKITNHVERLEKLRGEE